MQLLAPTPRPTPHDDILKNIINVGGVGVVSFQNTPPAASRLPRARSLLSLP